MCTASATEAAFLCACNLQKHMQIDQESFELFSVAYHLSPDSGRHWNGYVNTLVEKRCLCKLGTQITSPYIKAVYF